MRLLFIADGRSPIALNWIRYFVERGHAVHLVSTYPCHVDLELASLRFAPVAFSRLQGKRNKDPGNRDLGTREHDRQSQRFGHEGRRREGLWGARAVGARTAFRHWLGPLTLGGTAERLRGIIDQVRPELVHAMRIPYEGMAAALAGPRAPLLVSVWGNDFTLHAPSTPLMRRYTRLVLERSAGLHTDCQRDVRLARAWGLPDDRPAIVLPGGGGVQLEAFYPPDSIIESGGDGVQLETSYPPVSITKGDFTVINPRGIRAYVCNEAFFRAIPKVLQRLPGTRFSCIGMVDEPQALRWLDELGIAGNVRLLPKYTRLQMGDLFRQSQVVVSPSTHDGTPNTLLEAMACGCFPVAGDIESLREWITPGVNGLLVNPADPQDLAHAIIFALERGDLRRRGRVYNLELVARRAEHSQVMRHAEQFYRDLIP